MNVGSYDVAIDVDIHHRRKLEGAAGAVPRATKAFPTFNLIRFAHEGGVMQRRPTTLSLERVYGDHDQKMI